MTIYEAVSCGKPLEIFEDYVPNSDVSMGIIYGVGNEFRQTNWKWLKPSSTEERQTNILFDPSQFRLPPLEFRRLSGSDGRRLISRNSLINIALQNPPCHCQNCDEMNTNSFHK